jgi:hypothetical protein
MSTEGAQSTEQYSVRCIGPNGDIKWEDGFDNNTNNEDDNENFTRTDKR